MTRPCYVKENFVLGCYYSQHQEKHGELMRRVFPLDIILLQSFFYKRLNPGEHRGRIRM
jgi:hypothetical protein